jgi:hypothetical protein
MTRDEFVGYLAPRAESINLRLHRAGALVGLPCKFHQALALAQLLDALGQHAPSSEDLRRWYGVGEESTEETARWIYRVVGSLRDWDLEKLELGELMSFWVRFDTWGEAAYLLARDARARLRPAL